MGSLISYITRVDSTTADSQFSSLVAECTFSLFISPWGVYYLPYESQQKRKIIYRSEQRLSASVDLNDNIPVTAVKVIQLGVNLSMCGMMARSAGSIALV